LGGKEMKINFLWSVMITAIVNAAVYAYVNESMIATIISSVMTVTFIALISYRMGRKQ
jgi:hypothetical protein